MLSTFMNSTTEIEVDLYHIANCNLSFYIGLK